jgi:hypothetical protein
MDTTTGAAEVEANLAAALSETEESPTTETGSKSQAETESKGKEAPKTVPYTRFKEVIEGKNELKSQLDSLSTKFTEQSSALANLTKMLETSKPDTDLVRDIKALQHDPKMLPHLEAIDRALKGIEEEVEETGTVDKDKVADVKAALKEQKNQLNEALAKQQADLTIQRADAIADKWLEALPEEYTEQDRKVISKLWANEVDWDILESQPDKVQEHLKDTFKSVINDFGVPRGKLIDPDDPDSYEIEFNEPEKKTPEQELMEVISGKEYGKIVDVDRGGKKSRVAEVSDDEFAADMAKVLRGNRR